MSLAEQRFEVGEVAIVPCSKFWPEYNNSEVEVIGGLAEYERWGDRDHTFKEKVVGYRVRAQDGRIFVARPCKLRKKKPPRQPVSTWNDVIVWRPKETSHVH